MTVNQFILLPLRRIKPRVTNLTLRTNTNQFNVLSQAEFLDAARHARVNNSSISPKSSSAHASHSLSCPLSHCSRQHNHWRGGDEFEPVGYFTDAEIGVAWVGDTYQLGCLPAGNHHIVECPGIYVTKVSLIFSDKCLAEVIAVAFLIPSVFLFLLVLAFKSRPTEFVFLCETT